MHTAKWIHSLICCIALNFGLIYMTVDVWGAQTTLTVRLYGETFSLSLPHQTHAFRLAALTDEHAIERALADLEQALKPLASQLRTQSDKLRWNDWLNVKLAASAAKEVWKSEPERVFGCAALLRALGYNATLAVSERKRLWLAFEISQPVYFAAVFRLGEKNTTMYALYDIEKNDLQKTLPKDGLELLTAPMQGIKRAVSFEQPLRPTFPERPISKTLSWTYRGRKFSLTCAFNKNQLDYLAGYPQMEVAWYFNQALSKAFQEKVIEPLKKMLVQENLKDVEAVDFLLQFCLARPYLEDQKQPRGEHCSFVEEALFDAYTDCEDRAYLLAALVQGVLGYKVIGVQFPNHVAIGVCIPNAKLNGKIYTFENERYVSCDPSYLGSTVGEILEPFQHSLPERIIKIDGIKFVN
ncbi:MAG: hypothetical protein NZM05_07930 [Chloroherpetonaceae bacterium]|nr:hypothetical protein [Chloroherpetonaceae bacterium]